MLEKIKELRVKAESAKALLALADDETEKKHFKKLLDKYKQELLKFLDEPQPKPSRNEPQEPKRLSAILADNGTNLAEIDGDPLRLNGRALRARVSKGARWIK